MKIEITYLKKTTESLPHFQNSIKVDYFPNHLSQNIGQCTHNTQYFRARVHLFTSTIRGTLDFLGGSSLF